MCATAAVPAALVAGSLWDLPNPRALAAAAPPASTLILDREGRLLYEVLPPDSGRNLPLALTDIPLYLRLATMATEDAEFYRHPGLDLRAIARALYYDLRYRRVVSGGSTITQQVARNLLLREERDERTLRRKLREAALSLLIEARYSKDEILALYLNSTYYGRQAYGVEAAAQAFFGKPVNGLDLAESAFLAGLPQAPAIYDPSLGEAWRERQQIVLGLMSRQGYVLPEQAEAAWREPLAIVPPGYGIRAPHFVTYVRQQLSHILPAELAQGGGLRVYTTLDLPAQERAQEHVLRSLERINDPQFAEGGARAENAAVLALDVESGAIRVMVGSPDYFDDSVDGAVNGVLALRQPGSAIKPITYAAAFERDYTPATMVADVLTTFQTREGEPYVPLNYDLTFHGPVLLREALASSYNVVAVKVLDHIGLPAMLEMARRLGITTLDSVRSLGLAATLGGGEVSLLELTSAYSVFARGGEALPPYAIERVTDVNGNVLWEHETSRPRQILTPQVAYLITDILSDDKARIPTFGEGSILALSRPAAAKTGTTTDSRDNWTIGYTPQIAVGVWVGNADGGSMGHISGVAGAAPVWRDVMEMMLRGLPTEPFREPAGIVRREVCALSGLLPGPNCLRRRREVFVAGSEPRRTCDLHVAYDIDARTGYLADSETPREAIVRQVFVLLPPEALAWGEEHDIPRPPRPRPGSELASGDAPATVVITQPPDNGSFALVADLPASSQRIAVEAQVAGDIAIESVRLLVDGRAVAELRAPPYRVPWTLSAGEHVFTAEAIGVDGRPFHSDGVRIFVHQG